MLDIGVHLLDLALFLMGDFDRPTDNAVSGVTYSTFGHRGLGFGSGFGVKATTRA